MRYKQLKIGVILLLALVQTPLQAQQSINTIGGDVSASGGSVSYSIGQVAYQTHSSTNGTVMEGVQQPYEISLVTAIEEALGINLSFSVYPNPTANYLILEIKDFNLSTLGFQLFDMQGKLIQKEKITCNQTSLVMSNLVPATYFLKVSQREKELITFKIIKN